MKIAGRTFVMALALYAANASIAIAIVNAAGPMLSDAGKADIAKVATAATERGDVPGVVTVVVNRDGVLYEGAAGKQDVARGVAMPQAVRILGSMRTPLVV